ncbi:MAG: caspase family protein [Bacteroidota bacterium]
MNRLIFALILCFLFAAISPGQQKGFQQTDSTPSNPEERVALVIGNSDYADAPLLNPVNDARDIARNLESYGFKVILKENANFNDMKRAIREFGRSLHTNSVGLFYYSGHGMQVGGENYLIPVASELRNEEEIEYETVNAGFVLAQMEAARNRMNILVLDACRNNPFTRSFRSASRGLAMMNAPTGTLIAYATAPGSTASDGTGKNGLYTEELLAQMNVPGQKIEDVFKRVRANVMNRSNTQQIPWEASSLIGDFYFSSPKQELQRIESATASVVPISLKPSVTWRSDGESYWLTVDGNQIQTETVSGYSGEDLLVYHAQSSKTYILKDFKANGDNKSREAGELQSTEATFWKAKDALFWLTVNGTAIQQDVTSAWGGEDLVAYHRPSNITYVLRDFDKNSDEQYRTAEIFRSDQGAYWKAADGQYHLVIRGTSIQNNVVQAWSGNDLLAYYPVNNTSYVLTNYVNRQDNQLRTADVFSNPCASLWRASGTFYWLYVRGVSIHNETTSSYEEDDLIVVHTPTQQRFRLKNFKNSGDNLLRTAECLAE